MYIPAKNAARRLHAFMDHGTRRLHAFMDHGTRRLPGARIADAKKTAGTTPLAQEAKESVGKMPDAALGDGGASLNEAVSIAHVEEGASGKKKARQVYATLREPCQPRAG